MAIATTAAALGVSSVVALATTDGERPTSATPTAAATTSSSPSTSPPVQPPAEELAAAPPETIAGLVEDLTARPDAAGPAGPLLRDGLQGLGSEDEGVRQVSALQVLSVVISGDALDPRYATATRLALFRTLTGRAPAPAGLPSCLEVRQGTPPAVVQGYARQIVDALPAWQADGFPADESARLRELIAPVVAGQATLDLAPCPGQ